MSTQRCVVELADAGEIFPDNPTVMLVTDYPVRGKSNGGSQESPLSFQHDEFLPKIRK